MILRSEISELRDAGYDDLASRLEMYITAIEQKEEWLVKCNAEHVAKLIAYERALRFVIDDKNDVQYSRLYAENTLKTFGRRV